MCILGGFMCKIFQLLSYTLNWNYFILVLWINIISISIQWHKRDVQQLNIAMMFWMSTFLRNFKTSFVQQPIVELFLGHLTLEEKEEFVNANNTKGKKMINLEYLCTNC